MLGGWCAHGLLALETAQQLQRNGDEVALVVMLETVNPVRLNQQPLMTRLITRAQLKLNLLEFEYAYLRTLGREQARDYVSGRFARKFGALKRHAGQSFGTSPENQFEFDQQNLLEMLYAAAANYLPMCYNGPVMLVRSRRRLFGFANEPRLGWDESLNTHMEVCEAAGNHYTMYTQPNVESLAHLVASRLKAAEKKFQAGSQPAAALNS
jgi:thioesterase domain-containing protein